MSEADFQQMAAATRGAGPVGETASIQPAQPQAPGDEVVVGGNVSVAPPADQVDQAAMENMPVPSPKPRA